MRARAEVLPDEIGVFLEKLSKSLSQAFAFQFFEPFGQSSFIQGS